MMKPVDLAACVKALGALIHADAVCLWKTVNEQIVAPLACYPQGWLDIPFVMSPMRDNVTFHVETADILAQLPLSMRAKLTSNPPKALMKIQNVLGNEEFVGVIAIWNDLQQIIDRILSDNSLFQIEKWPHL